LSPRNWTSNALPKDGLYDFQIEPASDAFLVPATRQPKLTPALQLENHDRILEATCQTLAPTLAILILYSIFGLYLGGRATHQQWLPQWDAYHPIASLIYLRTTTIGGLRLDPQESHFCIATK